MNKKNPQNQIIISSHNDITIRRVEVLGQKMELRKKRSHNQSKERIRRKDKPDRKRDVKTLERETNMKTKVKKRVSRQEEIICYVEIQSSVHGQYPKDKDGKSGQSSFQARFFWQLKTSQQRETKEERKSHEPLIPSEIHGRCQSTLKNQFR